MTEFNWPIIGHQAIINYLQIIVANQRLHHAYLFYGPDGVGKSLIAEYFVKSIYCQSSGKKPCQTCVYCRQVVNQTHPDIIYLQVPSDKKNITIEQIREARERIQRSSFLNSYKIILIPQAHKLSLAASNGLLKILEEPSPQTIFILIAPDITTLPETILSRSQLIKFLPVGASTIKQALIKRGIERTLAHEISHLAAGLPGKIMPLIAHSQNLIHFKDEQRQLLNILNNGLQQRFSLINQLSAQSQTENSKLQVQNFLNKFILLMRDALLVKNMSYQVLVHIYLKDKLKIFASQYSSQQISNFIRLAERSRDLIGQNINQRLLLENLMLALENN